MRMAISTCRAGTYWSINIQHRHDIPESRSCILQVLDHPGSTTRLSRELHSVVSPPSDHSVYLLPKGSTLLANLFMVVRSNLILKP